MDEFRAKARPMSKVALTAENLTSSIALFRPNRPVVVSTLDRDGTPHLAPFSWCKPVSAFPPLVTLALLSSPRKQHSLVNIEREKEFVVNLPGIEFAAQLVQSSYRFPVGVRKAGIVDCSFGSSQRIRTHFVEQCLTHVECKLVDVLVTGDHTLLVGEVMAGAYVEDQYLAGFVLKAEQYPACLHLGHQSYQDCQVHVFMRQDHLLAVDIPYDLAAQAGASQGQQTLRPFDQLPSHAPLVLRDSVATPLATYAESLSCPTGLVVAQDGERLFFADWADGIVYQSGAGEKPVPFFDTQGMPTDMCRGADGSLYVADMGRKAILHVPSDGKGYAILEVGADQSLHGPLACAVGRSGQVYFTDANGMQPVAASGRLFRLREDGAPQLLLEGLVYPSALAFSEDGDTLYLAETFAKRIRRIRFGRDGTLAENEIIFRHEAGNGPVDIALGEDGRLYVAIFGSGEVLILDAHGKQFDSIHTPGMLPTSVAIGGQRLYLSDMECGNVIRIA